MSAAPALALDVLIVQSGNGPAYNDSIKGFKETYKGTTQTLRLSDYAEVDLVRIVKEEQPRLVLAVGDPALEKAKKVRQVPVVALMALTFDLPRKPASNIHGITVVASPDRYMQLFAEMGIKRVGIVYDRNRTGNYVNQAKQAAGISGIQLVAHEIDESKQVLDALQKMNGAVDALWMHPDITAVTSVSQEVYFDFSIRNQVPVVTFSEQYLNRGAAVSLDADRRATGRQAGELAADLLKKGARSSGTSVAPASIKQKSNDTILLKLGRKVSISPPRLTLASDSSS